MEAVEKTVSTKFNFKKNKAESSDSSAPTIMIEENLGSRHNPDFESLRLRWVTEGKSRGILAIRLGGGNAEQRHCVESFNVAVIEKFGLVAGANLNEALVKEGESPVRIAISEITQSEFDNLEDQAQRGYSAKANPTTGELIGKDGQQIYRKVYLTDIDVHDEYVVSDGKAVKITETTEVEADDIPA